MNYPYFPTPPIYPNINIIEEIEKLKLEIKHLNERINRLENKKSNDYLQNDDNFYMV